MKMVITQFNRTHSIKIKSLNKAIKALKKQKLNPQVSYVYHDTFGVLSNYNSGTLVVNIDIDFGLTHTFTLCYYLKWTRKGKPYVNTMDADTAIILDHIMNGKR